MLRMILLLVLSLAAPLSALDGGAIDQYVEQRLKDHLVRGGALVIVRDGRIVHSRAFGEARRGVGMTVDTPVVIGSLSKAFTATAVLQLADQGTIELDKPVQHYLRDFTLADKNAAAAITVRDLLNQTSGIPTDAPRSRKKNPSLEDHVLALASANVVAPRGQRQIYSSPNYQVLGLLVERVSGLVFGDYLKKHVFQPLGMSRSFVDLASAQSAGLSAGHNIWLGLTFPSSYRYEPDRLPTASIITTASDLSRFVSAHLGSGAPILSPESVRIAHMGVAPAGSFKYAMGWRDGETSGVKSLWHGGSLPSYRGAIVMLPESKTGIILLTNTSSMFADHTREIASGVVAILNGQKPPSGGKSLRMIYGFIVLAIFVILGLHIRSIIKSFGVRADRKTLLKVALLDVLLPVMVLVFLPRMTRIPWRDMYDGAPDVLMFLVVILATGLTAGVVRLMRARGIGKQMR